MLVAVMVIFAVCWMPTLLVDFSEATAKIFTRKAGTTDWIHTTRMWLQLLSCVNSCVNVFIYYWASESVYVLYIFEIKILKFYSYLLALTVNKTFHNFSQFRRAFRKQLKCFRRDDSGDSTVYNRSVSVVRNRKGKRDPALSVNVISTSMSPCNEE